MEKTLVIIKPDAVERHLIGKIISKYEEEGLDVIKLEMETATKEKTEEHYGEHREKPFFEELTESFIGKRIVLMILEGENAVEKVRKINGATNPDKAEEGTIRKLFAGSLTENSVHASDSPENFKREEEIWFGN